jgi:hypothetical protein
MDPFTATHHKLRLCAAEATANRLARPQVPRRCRDGFE